MAQLTGIQTVAAFGDDTTVVLVYYPHTATVSDARRSAFEPPPGQLPALAGEFIAEPVQLLFAAEQGKLGGPPFNRTADVGGRPRFVPDGLSLRPVMAWLLISLPGLGPGLAARLLTATCGDR